MFTIIKTKTTILLNVLLMTIIFFSSCNNSHTPGNDLPALKDVYEDAFLMGTALNRSQVYGEDVKGVELTKKHFNAITAENVTKWQVINPEPGVYNFEPTDRLVEFGEENDIEIIGHTLVWHSQTPRWVFEDEDGNPAERDVLLERMRNHIHTVAGRYKGRIHGWDVVNEALNGDGTLRETPWYNIIGKEYLLKAFEYAHEVDPNAELYYNDYSLEDGPKREGAIRIVKYLQENDVPITAVGTQGHYSLDWPELDEIEKTITDFAELGVDVMITELEIDVLPPAFDYMGADISRSAELRDELNPYPDTLPAEVEKELAQRYKDIFEIFLDHQDEITRVTFWGVADGDSWKNNWPVSGRTNYPLLFDRNWEPKPAFFSVVEITE